MSLTKRGCIVGGQFSETQRMFDFVSASALDHVVIVDISDQREHKLQLIRGLHIKRPLPVVVVISELDEELIARAIEAGAQDVVSKPGLGENICAASLVAAHQHSKQSRLEAEVEQLKAKLEERKLIE
ncbi:MAG: hypothetical protein AB1631_35035, partial [Acidobacteriota bacterium]